MSVHRFVMRRLARAISTPPPAGTIAAAGWGMMNIATQADYKGDRIWADALRGGRGITSVGGQYGYIALTAGGVTTTDTDYIIGSLGGPILAGVHTLYWLAGEPDITVPEGGSIGAITTSAGYRQAPVTVSGNLRLRMPAGVTVTAMKLMRPGHAFSDVISQQHIAEAGPMNGGRLMKCGAHAENCYVDLKTLTVTWPNAVTLSTNSFRGTINQNTSPATLTVLQGQNMGLQFSGAPGNVTIADGADTSTYWTTHEGTDTYHIVENRTRTLAKRQTPVLVRQANFAYSVENCGWPIEWQVEYFNAMAAACPTWNSAWFVLPYNIDDAHATFVFEHIRDNLSSQYTARFIELGNELVPVGNYPAASATYKLAKADVAASGAGSGLDYDSIGDATYWHQRWLMRRTRELGILLQAAAPGTFGTVFRVVFTGFPTKEIQTLAALQYLRTTFAQPANTYIHALSTSMYPNLSTAQVQSAATPADIATKLRTDPNTGGNKGLNERLPYTEAFNRVARAHGMATVIYEGGEHLSPISGLTQTEVDRVKASKGVAEFGTFISTMLTEDRRRGSEHFCGYSAGIEEAAYAALVGEFNPLNLAVGWGWKDSTGNATKRDAYVAQQAASLPAPAEIIGAPRVPGTVAAIDSTFTRFEYMGSGPSWTLQGNGNRTMGSGTTAAAWLEYGVYVDAAGTYTMSPWLGSVAAATCTIKNASGTTLGTWNLSAGPDPVSNAIAAGQTGVSVSLPQGWYGLRVEFTGTLTSIGIKQIVVS